MKELNLKVEKHCNTCYKPIKKIIQHKHVWIGKDEEPDYIWHKKCYLKDILSIFPELRLKTKAERCAELL